MPMLDATSTAVTLLLLDDHPLYRTGFAFGLRALRPEVRVLCAGTLDEALALADAQQVQGVLIDMHLGDPQAGGLAALDAFAGRHPRVARIVITGDTRPHLPQTCRQHGAHGFLRKSEDARSMWTAIDAALDGQARWPAPEVSVQAQVARSVRLTPRQAQVLQHLSEGMSNKAIAATIGLTERAIKMHMTNMLQLSGAANRVELLRVAREVGWLAG
ncbi:response regulator transcription factor [Variovorax sp. CF313]|uniref:response regulator transcription factor n=1 Tax=unclassified Variovorax TaxID=663243 RepID=UPI0002714DF0|nr:response regulator transcription factor [Variovorax sp. CF313]EJL72218.1 response regulator containing a CheY-like receiver domain and an HTH DNA-binding domain [Variovorax sp. CF313]